LPAVSPPAVEDGALEDRALEDGLVEDGVGTWAAAQPVVPANSAAVRGPSTAAAVHPVLRIRSVILNRFPFVVFVSGSAARASPGVHGRSRLAG
jgi:hypothetical protein